jgi:DNA-directed RNA polymerase II subunit RPB1
MTLDAFHYDGINANNVTLGVPGMRGIINVAKEIKTPSLFVYLKLMSTRQRKGQGMCIML